MPATVHASSATTRKNESPLVMRCVSSIIVSTRAECCITVPLHSGQWSPQPAPEPVARTSPPHKMTAMKYASTPQAKRRSAGEGSRWARPETAVEDIEEDSALIPVSNKNYMPLLKATRLRGLNERGPARTAS